MSVQPNIDAQTWCIDPDNVPYFLRELANVQDQQNKANAETIQLQQNKILELESLVHNLTNSEKDTQIQNGIIIAKLTKQHRELLVNFKTESDMVRKEHLVRINQAEMDRDMAYKKIAELERQIIQLHQQLDQEQKENNQFRKDLIELQTNHERNDSRTSDVIPQSPEVPDWDDNTDVFMQVQHPVHLNGEHNNGYSTIADSPTIASESSPEKIIPTESISVEVPATIEFVQGEKVLCESGGFLYPAKILEIRELDENNDECRVHFTGFSNDDDTWVRMDKIYKNTQENREFKKELIRLYKQRIKDINQNQNGGTEKGPAKKKQKTK